MSAQAAPAPSGPTFVIRGRPYPVLLPKLAIRASIWPR